MIKTVLFKSYNLSYACTLYINTEIGSYLPKANPRFQIRAILLESKLRMWIAIGILILSNSEGCTVSSQKKRDLKHRCVALQKDVDNTMNGICE